MKAFISVLILSVLVAGCQNDGDGDKGKGPTRQAAPGDDADGGDGANEEFGTGGSIACVFREPTSLRYFSGFGDTDASATAGAAELCRNRVPNGQCAGANADCEVRIAEYKWSCTVTNTRTNYGVASSGRSKIEAAALSHGLCLAGQNADVTVCGPIENATCVMQ